MTQGPSCQSPHQHPQHPSSRFTHFIIRSMAPATTASPSPSVPTAAAKDWTDFINTVSTSVGPLFTLFGEQTTKQFLSVSMGWLDSILLSVGLIGIITIVVSAIRIGGSRFFKALVGRYVNTSSVMLHLFVDQSSRSSSGHREGVSVTGFRRNLRTLEWLRDRPFSRQTQVYEGSRCYAASRGS